MAAVPVVGGACLLFNAEARIRPLRGFATHVEMRLRRSRQVGRGRRPSREAAARARANTPSEASAEGRRASDEMDAGGVL